MIVEVVTGAIMIGEEVTRGTVVAGDVVTGYCSDWRSSDRCYDDWRSDKEL